LHEHRRHGISRPLVLTSKLSDGVTELLTNRVDSFEKLELIVALQAAPRNTMSVDALCRQLKLSRDDIRQAAVELRRASLVELTSTGDVQLLPSTSHDHTAVTELVLLYEEDRLAVLKHMGEIALHRIRSMASTVFADAFVIRKKPSNDGEDG